MPNKTIWITQDDIEAAHRIASRMFKGRVMSDESVLSAAMLEGMALMRVAWEPGEVADPPAGDDAPDECDLARDALIEQDERP